MSWFTPKLEPGEIVLLKRSGGRRVLWIIALILFVFLPLEFGLFLADEPDGISAGRVLGLVVTAALALIAFISPLLLGESGWKLAVTNRRLIHRPDGLARNAEEFRIDEIETVRHDITGNKILLRGGTREISIDEELVKPAALNEAIESARDTPAQ